MRRIILALIVAFSPLVAAAQQPPVDAEKQALGQMVMEAMQREATLRAQLIGAQADVERLKAAKSGSEPTLDTKP